MKTNYDVNFFIRKFEAIPENEIGYFQSTGCAYGQCSYPIGESNGHLTEEGIAMTKLFMSLPNLTTAHGAKYSPYLSTPARINNGEVQQYQQPSPKTRLLAALYDIKMMQAKTIINKYVAVTDELRAAVTDITKECYS